MNFRVRSRSRLRSRSGPRRRPRRRRSPIPYVRPWSVPVYTPPTYVPVVRNVPIPIPVLVPEVDPTPPPAVAVASTGESVDEAPTTQVNYKVMLTVALIGTILMVILAVYKNL